MVIECERRVSRQIRAENLQQQQPSILTLVDKGLFELLEELQVQQVFGRQGFLTDDGFHGLGLKGEIGKQDQQEKKLSASDTHRRQDAKLFHIALFQCPLLPARPCQWRSKRTAG